MGTQFLGDSVIAPPPALLHGKILYLKISSGKIYTTGRYFPVDGEDL
jgi:hypothetical protein